MNKTVLITGASRGIGACTARVFAKNGYNVIINKMLENCDVELNVDYLKEKEKYDSLADKVLYTGMIDEYFNYSLGNLDPEIYLSYPSTDNCFKILETVLGLSPDIILILTSCSLKYSKVSLAFFLTLSFSTINPTISLVFLLYLC